MSAYFALICLWDKEDDAKKVLARWITFLFNKDDNHRNSYIEINKSNAKKKKTCGYKRKNNLDEDYELSNVIQPSE